MIDFFDKLYTSLRKNHPVYSFLRFTIRWTANLVLPVYFRITSKNSRYRLSTPLTGNGQLIVSLTSFPARIQRLWLVIECLLRQTRKPDRIILWLSEKQFPGRKLPQNLYRLEKRGLEIRWVPEDLRSHKKYYHTLQNYPQATLITIDDDIFYPGSMISQLLNLSEQYPSSVICHYARHIQYREGFPVPYRKWPYAKTFTKDDSSLFFGSGGGTLFPPGILHRDVLNQYVFQSLCFWADDIWLNAMVRLNRGKVVFSGHGQGTSPLPVINRKNFSLSSMNVDDNQNDIQLQAVREYYIQQLGTDPFAC